MPDEFLIQVHAIGQEHVSKGAPVLVLTMSLEDDISPEHERGRSLLRSGTKGLAFLRAVDAAEADALRGKLPTLWRSLTRASQTKKNMNTTKRPPLD